MSETNQPSSIIRPPIQIQKIAIWQFYALALPRNGLRFAKKSRVNGMQVAISKK